RVEVGYLTSPVDRPRLLDPAFRNTVAEGLLVAVQRLYLASADDPGTGVLTLPLGSALQHVFADCTIWTHADPDSAVRIVQSARTCVRGGRVAARRHGTEVTAARRAACRRPIRDRHAT